jgi:hypothetical protein
LTCCSVSRRSAGLYHYIGLNGGCVPSGNGIEYPPRLATPLVKSLHHLCPQNSFDQVSGNSSDFLKIPEILAGIPKSFVQQIP